MTADIIEGEAVEVESRALVAAQPGQAIVSYASPAGPADMIGMATHLATALKDIVDRQKLFTVISGKKFPQVEAWMTIGRMDNVVAREAERPIRNDDGSYEAFVELVRLSDGMVIGRASALCGTQDDRPWNSRSEPARRSMAVTRATSRAFRQQYSWIMALAGYEATPADEMPDANGETQQAQAVTFINGEAETLTGRVRRKGIAKKGGAEGYKLEGRGGPDGHVIGFRLEVGEDKAIPQVVVAGGAGEALWLETAGKPASLAGKPITVAGILYHVRSEKGGSWYRLNVDQWQTAEALYPAPDDAPVPADPTPLDPDIEAAADLAFPEAETAPLGLVS